MADRHSTTVEPVSALRELSIGNSDPLSGPIRDEEKLKLARDKGWAPQTPFNYDARVAPLDAGNAADLSQQSSSDGQVLPGWMHRAAKYEWKEDYGDIGPESRELEAELYGGEFRMKKGTKFDLLTSIKVVAEATERPAPIPSFAHAGLHPIMLGNVEKSGYDFPTPIQAYTIPAVLKGRDVIAVAQTGSGKTAAYMIPALSKLMGKVKKLGGPRFYTGSSQPPVRAEPLVLIAAPTRELCIQIFDEARRLCYRSMLRPCVAYGGGPIREQRDDLRRGCDVLIATPGRLIDFMKDPTLLVMNRLRFTIIDEADEMLHEDWQEDLQTILAGADANQDSQHQYLLFSATFDKRMRALAKNYLNQDYVRIRIGRAGSTVANIRQQIVWVDNNRKREALYDLLIASPPARTLIFVKSKKSVDFIDDFLFNQGLPTTSIHSERTQLEREDAIRSFRRGTSPILIATAVSARGLDIRNVMHIINYDLPSVDYGGQDEYIHRIGRTGRLGNEGLATSFYNESDEPLAPFLAKILVENRQPVPDFLEDYKPAENEPLNFDDDSGDEENLNVGDGLQSNGDAAGVWGSGSVEASTLAEHAWAAKDKQSISASNGSDGAWNPVAGDAWVSSGPVATQGGW